MKIDYDSATDTMHIVLKDMPVQDRQTERSGVVLSYDSAGQLVALLIPAASTRVESVHSVQLNSK